MARPHNFLILGLISACLCACGGGKPQASGRSVATQTQELNRAIGAKPEVEMVDLDGYNVPAKAREKIENSIAFSRPDDIVWTSRGQTEGELSGELQEILGRKKTDNGPWRRNYRSAMHSAVHQGKPILIWFTDSRRSAICAQLSDEIFSTKKFEDWTKDRVVKIVVDTETGDRESGGDEGTKASRDYDTVRKLRAKYRVRGNPTVVIQQPDGEIIRQYRGYTAGSRELYFGNMRGEITDAQTRAAAWRETLKKKGYREWTSRKSGNVVFCKLLKKRKDRITLIDPLGKRSTIPINRLSEPDQEFVELNH